MEFVTLNLQGAKYNSYRFEIGSYKYSSFNISKYFNEIVSKLK